MTAWEPKSIEAGGLKTRYIDVGSGDVVLLLHSADAGSSGTLEYRNNIEALREHFRVVAPDLMGYGGTSLPEERPNKTSQAYVDHVLAFTKALDIERAHFVGNSRGGLISIAISERHPDLVDRIVLLANAGGAVSKEYMEHQIEMYKDFKPTPKDVRYFLSGSYANVDRDVSQELLQEYVANAVVQYGGYDRIGGLPVDVPDLRPQLAKGTHSVLFVFGKKDDRWPPSHDALEVFLNTPRSRFYMMSDVGHHPQTEASDDVNALMINFLLGALDGEGGVRLQRELGHAQA